MTILEDRFGRRFPYLRLSIIEACNFRCTYCLPDGFHAQAGRPQPLSREEIARLLRGFAAVGLRKLRLTGGEPSLRRDLLSRCLDDGSRALGEVASRLGVSEPSAFSRWHRQQFGSAARQRKVTTVDSAITHRRSRR